MAKSRRKSNGCQRGKYKRKKMGKGWVTSNKPKRGAAPTPKKTSNEGSGDS